MHTILKLKKQGMHYARIKYNHVVNIMYR